MDTYGLLGFQLGHSFSAGFFNEKFRREGIEATYVNFEIKDVAEVRAIIPSHPELKGLNVTIPLKEAVIPYLDELTPEAKKIGAVNTIRVGETLIGHNTDYIG